MYAGQAEAQMSNYKFKQQFDKAFEHTLNGENAQALAIFQRLHAADKNHGQVTYLLALNHIKIQGAGEEAASYLNEAISKVSYYHQVGRVEDKTVPVKAWYYLAQSLAETNDYSSAINAYRNYMSSIQLAPLAHKREIVHAIQDLRSKKQLAERFGGGKQLAIQAP